MGVVANRYYNDPGLAQAAANLAGLFAAPSGSDLSGYASARQTNEESNRLAQLFQYAQSPDFNQDLFDRMNIANKSYAPASSYHAVDVDALTKRYGYDQSLAGTKYTADQALRGNIMNSLLAPVAEGATRFNPPSIAGAYDVPATQTGNIKTAPGDTVYKADGGVVMGSPKPLSETEQKAAERQDLIARHVLTDQDLADAIMGEQEPVQVLDADGVTTRWMTRGEATRTGADIIPTMDQTKALTARKLDLTDEENKRLVLGEAGKPPEVKQGTAVVGDKHVPVYFDDSLKQWIMPNKQPVPDGAQVYAMGTEPAPTKPDQGTALIDGKKVPVYFDGKQWLMPNQQPIPEGTAVTQMTPGSEPTPAQVEQGSALIAGQSVPVWFNPNTHQWIRSDTQEPVPEGTQVTKMGQPTGDINAVTTGTNTDIQKNLVDLATTKDTVIQLRDLIQTAPASQGLVGYLRGTAQDVAQVGGELSAYFGGDVQKEVDKAKQEIAAGIAGSDPGVVNDLLSNFDDKVPRIEMLSNLLAYQYSKLSGDRLSNETVRLNRQALGLENWTANQAATIAKLNVAIEMIERQEGILAKALNSGPASLATQAPPPPPRADIKPPQGDSTAAPAAPAATGTGGGGPRKVLRFDAQGNLIQ